MLFPETVQTRLPQVVASVSAHLDPSAQRNARPLWIDQTELKDKRTRKPETPTAADSRRRDDDDDDDHKNNGVVVTTSVQLTEDEVLRRLLLSLCPDDVTTTESLGFDHPNATFLPKFKVPTVASEGFLRWKARREGTSTSVVLVAANRPVKGSMTFL